MNSDRDSTHGFTGSLSWWVWALTVLLVTGALALSVLNRHSNTGDADTPLFAEVLFGLILLAFGTVGALVIWRRARNPIGWILLGAAVAWGASALGGEYGTYALITDPERGLPGGLIAAWTSTWIYVPAILTAPALLFLLFPDGRLSGARWRFVFWLIVVATSAATVDAFLAPVLEDAPFEGLASPLDLAMPDALLATLSLVGWPGMTVGLLASAAAMISRLRRSAGVQRHQLKWFAAAAGTLPILSLVGVISYYAGLDAIGGQIVIYSFAIIAFTAGYAILRHRLYDIDVVINRALVYSVLTAVLAGIYYGLVLLLGVVLSPVARGSNLVVAMSTLCVAAGFRPIRGRVQSLVDRRFYRQRYDAVRTLERFAARLRAQTDIETLGAELSSVVRETLHPTHVGLWLR